MLTPELVLYMNVGSLGEELLFVCKQLVHVTLQSVDTLDTQVGNKFPRIYIFEDLKNVSNAQKP